LLFSLKYPLKSKDYLSAVPQMRESYAELEKNAAAQIFQPKKKHHGSADKADVMLLNVTPF
jgi:GrpB-like predicted nucleotidyltransferase (UPF0157 family)